LTECPQCHKPRLPHTVCPSCGYYKGEEIITPKAEKPA
jgi:large subunit ribosomal protein L32